MAKNKGDGRTRSRRPATEVVLAGRNPAEQHGFVNTPIYRGSTVLAPSVEQTPEWAAIKYAGHEGGQFFFVPKS